MQSFLTTLGIILLSAFSFLNMLADNDGKQPSDIDDEVLSDEIMLQLDSMITQLYEISDIFCSDTSYLIEKFGFACDSIPVYNDSIILSRYAQIQSKSIIPLTYNKYVQNYIDAYLIRKRLQVSNMIGLSKIYYPIFEEILDKYNMPLELKHLAVVESALNPHAVSRVGATGLWQFMYGTGKSYGLNINSYIDERRDPYLATETAAKFLSDLYKRYDDWLLAIAAYNCGPGNVNRAIRRSGGLKNFWLLREYLPKETRGYVPAFIAANYVMNFYELHNIYPGNPPYYHPLTDTIMIYNRADFEQLSAFLNIPEEELKFLNPQYRHPIIPQSQSGSMLRLPLSQINLFDQYLDSIYKYSSPIETTLENDDNSKDNQPTANTSGNVLLHYTVKSGDNLGYIAEWYKCSAQDIRNWNNMYGSSISVGKKLSIYVPKDQVSKYENINNMTFAQKQTQDKSTATHAHTTSSGYLLYKVKSGDTLWQIAKDYPCSKIDQIKQDNNLQGSGIKPGMTLKIKNDGC